MGNCLPLYTLYNQLKGEGSTGNYAFRICKVHVGIERWFVYWSKKRDSFVSFTRDFTHFCIYFAHTTRLYDTGCLHGITITYLPVDVIAQNCHSEVTITPHFFPCPLPSPPLQIPPAPSTFERRTNEKRRSRPKARTFIGVPQPSVFVVWLFLCCVYYSLSINRYVSYFLLYFLIKCGFAKHLMQFWA